VRRELPIRSTLQVPDNAGRPEPEGCGREVADTVECVASVKHVHRVHHALSVGRGRDHARDDPFYHEVRASTEVTNGKRMLPPMCVNCRKTNSHVVDSLPVATHTHGC
jgi:hypothetical protein